MSNMTPKRFRVEFERILIDQPHLPEVSSDLYEEGDELLVEGQATTEHLVETALDKDDAEEMAEEKLYALSDAVHYDLNIISAEEVSESS